MKRRSLCLILAIIATIAMFIALIAFNIYSSASGETITCWAICKPGNYIVIRRSPQKNAMQVGFLDPCDPFQTDGESQNGFIHAVDIGDDGEGWVYCGFVSTEEPEPVFERYYCSSRSRVVCRRWISGPQISGRRGWIYNGDTLEVFYRTDTWSITSRGYIKSEWLEPDP